MRILGYSGLSNSVAFKRQCFPALDERQYRIAEGLNSAAALVVDGRVVAAAAEERFVRRKGTGEFPKNAMRYCLSAGNLHIEDIDLVAHAFDYQPYLDRFLSSEFHANKYANVFAPELQKGHMSEHFPSVDWENKLVFVPHHLAHAASAYYLSGFPESLIVVIDGSGEIHGTTIAVGQGSDIRIIRTIPTHASLGILYGIFTMYLGFTMDMHEYKVMAMAGYGDSTRYFDKIMDDVLLIGDGTFDIPLLRRDANVEEMETHSGVLRYLSNRFGPPRLPSEEVSQRHFDLAAGIQAVLETCLLHVVRHFSRETGMDRLCLAGGVALNCKANGLIQRSRLFRSTFIQPAAGDDGTALGAAIFTQARYEPVEQFAAMELPLWGSEESDAEFQAELSAVQSINIETHSDGESAAEAAAKRLADGEIIAWHQGRMEFGPRALGNRSILADPRQASMRDRINRIIKYREDFQPFAPSVPAERAQEIFDIADDEMRCYRHMSLTAQVREQYRKLLAAVTHVDGSARVQIVNRHESPLYWHLLSAFAKFSGIPVLLNTSLNVASDPICRSASDSLKTFLTSPLDALYMGRFAVTRFPVLFDR